MVRFQMSSLVAKSREHVVKHAISIVLAVITQVIVKVFFTLSTDSNKPNALFHTSFKNVSETFPLDVTMDSWSEIYWTMIDFWSMAWLLHAVVGLFKRHVLSPEIHPPAFYLTWTLINIARMCSMFLWDVHDIRGAVVSWWFLPVLSFYMLSVSCYNLNKHKASLAINSPGEILWTRYLTQNGLAMFAWWSLLNAVVGLGIALKYESSVPDPLVSTITLTILALCTICWFILQCFLLNKYLRYTFTVYPIVILGLGAMFTRSYRLHDFSANTVYCGSLMLLMTIMSLLHLISECFHSDKSSKTLLVGPHMAFEGCNTVYKPEGDVKHKPQK